MYHIYNRVKERMGELLMAETNISQNVNSGSKIINVEDGTYFNYEGINERYPEIAILDKNSTARRIGSGYEGVDIHNLTNAYEDTLEIEDGVSQNWTTDNDARVIRAPAGEMVRQVKIGDLAVIKNFPTLCIIPDSKNISWYTLSGTMETITIDFLLYAMAGDTEQATEVQMKLADVIEYILMSNLHIAPTGSTKAYQVTSRAMCKRVKYGTIEKGSQFIKAATLTWEADMYIWRGYLTSQGAFEAPMRQNL